MDFFTTRLKPGSAVPSSGIYFVTHSPAHAIGHEVTCIEGTDFPICTECDRPYFQLVRAAILVDKHESFVAGNRPIPVQEFPSVLTEPAEKRVADMNDAYSIKDRTLMIEVLQDLDALLDDTGACLFPQSPIVKRMKAVLERLRR
jgi:hypothetical protein